MSHLVWLLRNKREAEINCKRHTLSLVLIQATDGTLGASTDELNARPFTLCSLTLELKKYV